MRERGSATRSSPDSEPDEFLDWLKKGMLLGALLLVLLVLALRVPQGPGEREPSPQQSVAGAHPQLRPEAGLASPGAVRLADFRGEDPSPDARLVADWVAYTHDNKRHAFAVVDKKDARVYVFTPQGRLVDSAPALFGSAIGDDSYPGIGDKPLSAIKPHEKTTPAGRFVAEMGENANHEDVVWVDYDAAVSMHRIRPTNVKERRLERLASLTVEDNRISFGCINLPVTFYENVLSPAVKKQGVIVYVLPETRSPRQVFGAWDVRASLQRAGGAVQPVAMRRAAR